MNIRNVIAAIRSKWPNLTRPAAVVIQQDNAKPHISPSDIAFNEAALASSMDIQLSCQLPNSPDTNVLVLVFSNVIQALQHQKVMNSINELIAAIQAAFKMLDMNKLNKVFLTHDSCTTISSNAEGGNRIKFPIFRKVA
ncbi:hypothetical protein CCR75_000250 [Bremia lactucae]|uniref:Uncharacterized protein n=1 Tax=Bremia lactucae TaxID=4779 RepID=A0A976FEC9_BRELC|nr:hypothetical protein CCR75_000250 [Bremia lactucae]